MLIENKLLHFCARKTKEVVEQYLQGWPTEAAKEFPRSVDDLHWIVSNHYGKPVLHRELRVSKQSAKFRSLLYLMESQCALYYVRGLSLGEIRYHKAKELFQLYIYQEALATADIVELVKNMIKRSAPESMELHLGHATTSDTLGDIAAMEFLFPMSERKRFKEEHPDENGVVELATKYGIPPYIAQRCLYEVEYLDEFFK